METNMWTLLVLQGSSTLINCNEHGIRFSTLLIHHQPEKEKETVSKIPFLRGPKICV
jgi:hypothetical protein